MIFSLLAQANQQQQGIGSFEPPTNSFLKNATDPAAVVGDLEKFISNMIGLITIFAGLAFVLYFVMGGLNWITSAGDQGKTQKARDQMVQAVLGMIIIAISYGLIGILGRFFGLDLLQPGNAILKLGESIQ